MTRSARSAPPWRARTAGFLRAAALGAAASLPAALAQAQGFAQAQPPSPSGTPRAEARLSSSTSDALMFYQLLIAEMELQNGRPGVAVDVLLDAARRSRDEQLYQRAVDVALEARAADKALASIGQWRAALPESTLALRYQVQLLGALDRPAEALEPVRAWLARATPPERLGVFAALP